MQIMIKGYIGLEITCKNGQISFQKPNQLK